MHYVIIGSSTAAVGAVEGIRQIDTEGSITLITSESHHTYSRPLISYLLLGKVTEEGMYYRPADFFSSNDCTVLYGTVVASIDPALQQVLCENGETLSYDKLLVATGSSPFVPPMEGLESVEEQTTFMSLDDAHTLDGMLSEDKNVLIVGAGLIGLKCAEGILKRVNHITVIDLAPTILSSILNVEGAAIVQKHLEEQGVEFKLGTSVAKFEGTTALLQDGESLEFDIAVLAVGVRPNTALLKDLATTERAIVINEKSETSVPNIYAAGDCTQTNDVSSGTNRIMALLPNAYLQGECAGINMAGGEKTYDKAIPMNAIGFAGLHIITAGSYSGDEFTAESDGSYKRLFYSDNALNGFILIGDVDKAGIYTSLIRERTPLDSIDFELIREQPGLMAFAKSARAEKLGGKHS